MSLIPDISQSMHNLALTASDLVGRFLVIAGETRWVDGPLAHAVRMGTYHEGIHPFCITKDSEARDYLPHWYGAVNYVLGDEVRKLPLKVSDIYRKLTA